MRVQAQDPGGQGAAIEIAARTDVGLRRSENQDGYGSWSSGGRTLLALADGMGGHRGGATASQLALEEIGRSFESEPEAPAPDLLQRAFLAANRAIHERASRESELRGMGSTAVALLLQREAASQEWQGWVAHVGDSRLYRLCAGRVEPLTRDHTVRAELRERRELSEEEIQSIPGAGRLLRALGPWGEIEIEVHPLQVRAGEVFLLCSDGLTGMVAEPRIAEMLSAHPPIDAARMLVEEANREGGVDNITVVIAALPPQPQRAAEGVSLPRDLPAAAREGDPPRASQSWRLAWVGIALAVLSAWIWLDPQLWSRRASPVLAEPAQPSAPDAVGARGDPDPDLAPAFRSAPRDRMRSLARAVVNYADAARRCDLAALERLAEPLALVWAQRRCEGSGASTFELVPLEDSLHTLGDGRVQLDLEVRSDGPGARLLATLQQLEDGSWRIADLLQRSAPTPNSNRR